MWLMPQTSQDTGLEVIKEDVRNQQEWKDNLAKLRYNIENYPQSSYHYWYMLQLANKLYALDEHESAVSLYKELELLPDSAKVPQNMSVEELRTEAKIGLARYYTISKNQNLASKYLKSILPRNDEDRLLLAELNYRLNRKNTALKILQSTAGVEMSDTKLKLRAAQIYHDLSFGNEAQKLWESILKTPTSSKSEIAFQSQARRLYRFAQIQPTSNWTNGKFDATVNTAEGKLTVKVTINNDKIETISFIVPNNHKPITSMPNRMIISNSVIVDPMLENQELAASIQSAVFLALQMARRN